MTYINDKQEAEQFLEEVNEVSMLIEGLKAGTISPEYIDRKRAIVGEKTIEDKKDQDTKKPASRKTGPIPHVAGKDGEGEDDTSSKEEQERNDRIMKKVEELKANRERKLKARQRYEDYTQQHSAGSAGQFATDYTKWDMWCPEDEEDELFNSLTPSNPQFRALEKDIDERHKRMVEQRQIAERQRVAGNEAFKRGQYSEALRCYQVGLGAQKTSMPLHANAAQAALKLNCFVQAIEHCDKVLSIADFLYNNLKDPLCVKARTRRAAAYRALQQYDKAVQDLQAALEVEPNNKEIVAQLAKAQLDLDEYRKAKQIRKAMKAKDDSSAGAPAAGGAAGAGAATDGVDLEKLRKVEQHVQALRDGEQQQQQQQTGGAAAGAQPAPATRMPKLPPKRGKGGAAGAAAAGKTSPAPASGAAQQEQPPQVAAAQQLQQLLRDDDACCVYFRECGGLQAAAAAAAASPQQQAGVAAFLDLLNTAAMNDGNLLQLPACHGLLEAAVAALGSSQAPAAAAAARLLCTATTNADVRKTVSKHLGTKAGLTAMLQLLRNAAAPTAAVALAVLSNCMVDQPCKAAMLSLLEDAAATQQPVSSGKAGASESSSSSNTAAGEVVSTLVHLMDQPNAVVGEKVLTLVGNMCGEATLRAQLQAQPQLLKSIVRAATSPSNDAACEAALTALYNLCIDAPAQLAVAESGRVAHLVGMLGHGNAALVARTAGVLSRAAKQRQGAALLMGMQGMQALLQLVDKMLDVAAGSSSSPQPQSSSAASSAQAGGHHATALDAAVRTITILTANDKEPVDVMLAAQGVPILLRALSTPGMAESVQGNAALCIAHVAKYSEHLPTLRSIKMQAVPAGSSPQSAGSASDAVAVLVQVAYAGKGNTASKNAAIALARMAHDAPMLERLRELHGIEIIYQYVKP